MKNHFFQLPAISVISVTPTTYEVCRRSIRYLREQTAKDQVELIIVGQSREIIAAPENQISGFCKFQIVEIGKVQSIGQAVAAGVQAARGPVVAYLEEHSFPQNNWIEVLIEEHQKPYTAVGWGVRNANPGSLMSWAVLYGLWAHAVAPVMAGEYRKLSGHHTSYKRSVLLDYGTELAEMINNEILMHLDLHAKGHTLYLTDRTVSRHINISKLWKICVFDFISLRGFAAQRARIGDWSVSRKLLFTLGAPLLPWLRLGRIVVARGKTKGFWSLMPGLALLMLIYFHFGMVGEIAGYWLGNPEINNEKKLKAELNRKAYIRQSDLEQLSELIT